MTKPQAILTDATKCIGCEKCVDACKRENHLPDDLSRSWKVRIDSLSSTRFTTVVRHDGEYVREQCRHCVQPACVSACPVGALQKRSDGPVVYDSDRCMGCRYCMMACPFGVPRYEWEKAVPHIKKCTMCAPRLDRGLQPACVEACPTHATIFGDRDELLAEAHRRLRASPERYLQTVYGENDVGGTSVLLIAGVPLDFLNRGRAPGDRPLPSRTWAALSKVPTIVLAVGGLAAGTWWITRRRMKLAEMNAEALPDSASGTEAHPSGDGAPQDSREAVQDKGSGSGGHR